jgi:hypothetical protein
LPAILKISLGIDRTLGDIRGKITYALKITVHLENPYYEPQINGDRLVKSQNLKAFLFGIDLHAIYLDVLLDYLPREQRIAVLYRLNRQGKAFLDGFAKKKNLILESFDLTLQML